MRTEKEVKEKLSLRNYSKFLNEFYPKSVSKDIQPYWDPETGSCGFHARFTLEALGVKPYRDYTLVHLKDIDSILERLEKGEVIEFLHNYPTDAKFSDLPKDNRYGNHIFVVVKGGSHYFLSQGYLHKYKHSLRSYTKEEVKNMLEDIITNHSDYENTKKWKDIDISLHKKYFMTDLRLFPDNPPFAERKVNQIVLFQQRTVKK